jgi:hypothetical protein
MEWHRGGSDVGEILARALLAQWEELPLGEQELLECDSCGSFPERAGLLDPTLQAGDLCPARYLDDWDCDGKLIRKRRDHERDSQE